MVGIFTAWCFIPHSKRTRYASGAGLASCRQDSPVLRTWEILHASGPHQIEVGIPQYVRTREIPNLDPSLRLFRFAEDASLHPQNTPLPYLTSNIPIYGINGSTDLNHHNFMLRLPT